MDWFLNHGNFVIFNSNFSWPKKTWKSRDSSRVAICQLKTFLFPYNVNLEKFFHLKWQNEIIFKWYSYVLHLYRTAAMLFLTLSILLQTIPNIFCGNKSFAKKIPEKITTKCCFCMQLASLLHFPTRAFKYYVDHFLPYFDHLSTSGWHETPLFFGRGRVEV